MPRVPLTDPPTTTPEPAIHPAATPGERLRAWPVSTPVAVVCQRDAAGRRTTTLAAVTPAEPVRTADPLAVLGMLTTVPDGSLGVLGWLNAEFARTLEPHAAGTTRPPADRPWLGTNAPAAVIAHVRAAADYDHAAGTWTTRGDADLLPTADSITNAPGFATEPFAEDPAAADRYRTVVRRALAYIAAGDVYQVNLTHRPTTRFAGSPRALMAALLDTAQPWHGAYLEWTDHRRRCALCSASPELFLRVDPTGRVRTSPMKGTRPGTADVRELHDAAKDQAELAMIVDLMRNDLGRVCRFGSMRVTASRTIEHHGGDTLTNTPGVLQATATIEGELRPSATLPDLLAATFPPGSVTGAPKIRALQLIDELEDAGRGPYCGSFIHTGADGSLDASVLIRTALVHGEPDPACPISIIDGVLDYPVGAGIVADSDPDAEWQETLVKRHAIDRVITHNTAHNIEEPQP